MYLTFRKGEPKFKPRRLTPERLLLTKLAAFSVLPCTTPDLPGVALEGSWEPQESLGEISQGQKKTASWSVWTLILRLPWMLQSDLESQVRVSCDLRCGYPAVRTEFFEWTLKRFTWKAWYKQGFPYLGLNLFQLLHSCFGTHSSPFCSWYMFFSFYPSLLWEKPLRNFLLVIRWLCYF